MTFGDWETFKAAIMILRDSENKPHVLEKAGDDNANNNNNKETVRISVTSPGSPSPSPNEMSKPTGGCPHSINSYLCSLSFVN